MSGRRRTRRADEPRFRRMGTVDLCSNRKAPMATTTGSTPLMSLKAPMSQRALSLGGSVRPTLEFPIR